MRKRKKGFHLVLKPGQEEGGREGESVWAASLHRRGRETEKARKAKGRSAEGAKETQSRKQQEIKSR